MSRKAFELSEYSVNEIKSTLKPSFRRPYLSVKVQNAVSVKGLYDTGADISCLSLKVFRQISPENRPKKLETSSLPKFKSAGGGNFTSLW